MTAHRNDGPQRSLPARDWKKALAPYRESDARRSIIEVLATVVPLVLLWIAAWAALSVSYVLTLLICVPAAAFLVRLFLIQHDCGHGSFFESRQVNDTVGRLLGVFTLTPYDVWRHSHAIHHAGSGHLDHRGIGDIETLTVEEYKARSWFGRLRYRLYRHPLVMFGIGPAYLFIVQHRFPIGKMRYWQSWVSTLATNAGLAVFAAIMIWIFGLKPFLMVHLPIAAIGASMGVWLFYIQHQFEDTFWADGKDWSHQDAALYGSSHLDLPFGLNWLTAYIGVHHVHHLVSRIPFYRLPDVLRDYPELAEVRRITLLESFRHIRLKLWDPEQRRLVAFSDVRA